MYNYFIDNIKENSMTKEIIKIKKKLRQIASGKYISSEKDKKKLQDRLEELKKVEKK
jgi:hypothetical protein